MTPLRFWHTADVHARAGFAPRLRALRAAEPGAYVDCGDALRGSQTVYRGREPVIGELAAAGCDAMALGNREFHYLFPLLARRAARMPWPLLCANLVDRFGRTLPFRPWLDLELAGSAVRLFGLMVCEYPAGSPWERLLGWRFEDPVETARRVAAETPAATTLVLLSHLGLPGDRAVALAEPRIDLVLGGHSHDTLAEPAWAGDVPIVHAGPYGAFVSRTELRPRGAHGRAEVARFDLVPLGAA